MGRTRKYYPSTAFLPSVTLGALLTPSTCRDSGASTSACRITVSNGQYALVQPIAAKFAERCISTTLTPSGHAQLRTTENV